MNLLEILTCCPKAAYDVVQIIKWVINILCFAIPIIIIILCILDIAKIVTAGNIDDKLKKEVKGRITTRLIFAVIIFLVPTIVRLIFDFSPVVSDDLNTESTLDGATWKTCWDAKKGTGTAKGKTNACEYGVAD